MDCPIMVQFTLPFRSGWAAPPRPVAKLARGCDFLEVVYLLNSASRLPSIGSKPIGDTFLTLLYMDATPTVPHHLAVAFAYDQAKEHSINRRFPCNPDIEDLCDRGEYAGLVPVITFLPAEKAQKVFSGKASIVCSDLPPS